MGRIDNAIKNYWNLILRRRYDIGKLMGDVSIDKNKVFLEEIVLGEINLFKVF